MGWRQLTSPATEDLVAGADEVGGTVAAHGPVTWTKVILDSVVVPKRASAIELPDPELLVVAWVARDHLLTTTGARTVDTVLPGLRDVVGHDLARSTAVPVVMVRVGVVERVAVVPAVVVVVRARPIGSVTVIRGPL